MIPFLIGALLAAFVGASVHSHDEHMISKHQRHERVLEHRISQDEYRLHHPKTPTYFHGDRMENLGANNVR